MAGFACAGSFTSFPGSFFLDPNNDGPIYTIDRTLGTPYEGTGPPELYHKYTGHDDNRDWYAFTQVETQITVDRVHNVWHPQIVHDIHQQGPYGSRLFLPPYMQPVEPNVPRQLVEGYTELGHFISD